MLKKEPHTKERYMEHKVRKEIEYLDTLEAVHSVFKHGKYQQNLKAIRKEIDDTYGFDGFCSYLEKLVEINKIERKIYFDFLEYLVNFPPKKQKSDHKIKNGKIVFINNYLFPFGSYRERIYWLLERIRLLKLEKMKEKERNEYSVNVNLKDLKIIYEQSSEKGRAVILKAFPDFIITDEQIEEEIKLKYQTKCDDIFIHPFSKKQMVNFASYLNGDWEREGGALAYKIVYKNNKYTSEPCFDNEENMYGIYFKNKKIADKAIKILKLNSNEK